MTNSPPNLRSEENRSLIAFSDQLATIVEQAGASVVAMNGRRRRSTSGVYWRPGIIVTAEHAIGRDDELTVTLPDDRTVTATLVGRDPGTDLAVLQLSENSPPALQVPTVGDPAALKVGHLVLAIARGSDSGVSASFGVISAIGGTWRSWHGGRIDQFIRPSVMLYPGFSGSALVDTQGQVVGINTAGPRHMALTIPASTVNRVVDRLLQGGGSQRGFLGLGMQSVELPRALLDRLHLANRQGVIVVSVEPDGPAEQAGVLLGDILIALGGAPISDVGDVHNLLDPEQVGQPLTAQIIRGGALIEITITVGERPHQTRG
ncbi:MAG: S1C family serine protease [Stenomitos rutilans HA7619-LM2]|jgi:S1-C subfamily serine protease|nr:S1C family serine protease [Stenomitos rutilans HA7619-LM2]